MKKNSALILTIMGVLLIPALASAQGATTVTAGFGTLNTIITSFTSNIVRALVGLFAAMAMAAFFWGLVQYIWGAREGKEDQISKGNKFMIWGLLALFVMFSVWGIIKLFQGVLFGSQNVNTIIIPDLQIGGSQNNNLNPLQCPPNQAPDGRGGCVNVN